MTYSRRNRSPRVRRPRRARGNPPLEQILLRVAAEIAELEEEVRTAPTAAEKDQAAQQLTRKLEQQFKLTKQAKRYAKAQKEAEIREQIGTDKVLPVKVSEYTAVIAGTKTLLLRSGEAARKVGIPCGEDVEVRTARVAMRTSGDRPIKKVWLTCIGTYSTGKQLIKAAGGWDAFLVGVAKRWSRAEAEKLKNISLYRISLTRPTDVPVRAGGPALPRCSESTRPMNLYVLPITPVMAKRYLMATLLYMADLPGVSTLVESAHSEEEAMLRLKSFTLTFDKGDEHFELPLEYAKRLARLNLNTLSGGWEKARTQHATPGIDRQRHNEGPIDFGFYGHVLGTPGSFESLVSAFGTGATRGCQEQEKGQGDLEEAESLLESPWGASSLASLVERWEAAQRRPVVKRQAYPTFYRAAGAYAGSKGQAPLALVVSGPRGTEEGYRLHPDNRGVPAVLNMVALTEALVWGNPRQAAFSVCFLLPPLVVKGERARAEEVTGVREYGNLLLVGKQSPLNSFPLLARLLPKDTNSATAAATENRVNDLFQHMRRIKFYQSLPAGHWRSFFGELPIIQNWPGIYWTAVDWGLNHAMDRAQVSQWLKEEGKTLGVFREVGEDLGLKVAYSAFSEIRRDLKQRSLSRTAARRSLVLEDLTHLYDPNDPSPRQVREFGQATFIQIEEGPQRGLVIPVQVVITRDGGRVSEVVYDLPNPDGVTEWRPKGTPEGDEPRKLYYWREKQFARWWDDPLRHSPPIKAQVMLIKSSEAIKNIPGEEEEGGPLMTPGTVKALLGLKAQPIGRERGAEGGRKSSGWFLGLPGARYPVKRMKVTTRKRGDGSEHAFEHPDVEWFFSPMYSGKGHIRRIARDLLRIDVGIRGSTPRLIPAPSGPQNPWDAHGAPYLFSKMPVYIRSKKRIELMPPGEVGPDKEGYISTFLSVFGLSQLSSAARGGQAAVLAAQELGGKRTKGGRSQEATRVPTKDPFKPKSFYTLALDIIKAKGLPPLRGKEAKFQLLYDTLLKHWDHILLIVNEMRMEEGREPYPPNVRPPVPVEYGGSPSDYNVELESDALMALASLVDEDTGNLHFLFEKDYLLHPSKARVSGEGEGDTSAASLFPQDVRGAFLSLDNPSGRRPRRNRRRRRKKSSRKGRRNPLDKEQMEEVSSWLKDAQPDVSDPQMFQPAATNTDLFLAVNALFPRRAQQKHLAPSHRFGMLRGHDIFSSLDPAAVDEREQAIAKKLILGEDLAEAEQQYLALHAGLSAAEGRAIMVQRSRSKRRGRMITASGAICMMRRNTARLMGYSSALPVGVRGGMWILIGPPQKEGDPTRVMSFRNGTHIDCDELVPEGYPLSAAIGKAIQGMMIWLAGKKGARTRRMPLGLHIGLIGAAFSRTLWVPGDRLDVSQMLQRAYAGKKDLNFVLVKPGVTPPVDQAQAIADKDKERYWVAEGYFSLATRPPDVPGVEGVEGSYESAAPDDDEEDTGDFG